MSVRDISGTFYLGKKYSSQKNDHAQEKILYKSKNLLTHAVCVGMTGSGKTGLGISLLEEAALDSIPSIVIDPKGDIGNILLTFPGLTAEEFKPWIDQEEAERKGKSLDSYAEEVATTWKEGLKEWDEPIKRVQDFKESAIAEIYTPASRAGIPLSILGSFKAPTKEFLLDTDGMRERVLSTTSSLLNLLGIDADPIQSKEHILISTIIDDLWRNGKDLDLKLLIQEVQTPPFDKIGALEIDTFFPPKDRLTLSIKLNNLLASPGFTAWTKGVSLDIQELLYTSENKPKISILSIAHLTDSERMFFVTLFLNQMIAWSRKQPGTSSLKAIFYMDEIYGYFPPVANPSSKSPMITLLKQARAYGLGIVLCTQNPVDLDYKGLSNCGTWFIGRLQTDRDKKRVIEGLTAASNGETDLKTIDSLMSDVKSRVFIMRSIYEKEPILFQTRWTLSYLRGPLTLSQIEILMKDKVKGMNLDVSTHINDKKTNKPTLPSFVSEYFVNSVKSPVSYTPLVVGFCKLHFVDKKNDIDMWEDVCLTKSAESENKIESWEGAESDPQLKERLSSVPSENANYEEISSGIFQEKHLKQGLLAHLYQNSTLKLFEYKDLKLISKSDETEDQFRERVLSILTKQKSTLVEKTKDQYAQKIATLKDKIRRAEEKKNTQQQQSLYQKFEALLSVITTIIGMFFGKKVTKTSINQAGTTFKRVGRIGKEAQDVTVASENLEALQHQLQTLESNLENEIADLLKPAAHLEFDEIVIRPRKADIAIDQIAIVWQPKP